MRNEIFRWTGCLLSAAVSLAGEACFAADSKTASVMVENFESDKLPAGYLASKGSELDVTAERFKSGAKSLRWTWSRPEARLAIPAPGGLAKMGEKDCLAFWLYNEYPKDKLLRLELLRDGNVIGKCWYVLNFKGWRPLAAPYAQVYAHPESFTKNPSAAAIDSFRLISPAGEKYGRLYLDYVNFKCSDKPHADNQQPWVDNPEMLAAATPEKFIYSTHDLSKNRPWLPKLKPAGEITEVELADMAKILERCVDGDKAGGLPRLYRLADGQGLADAKILDDSNELLKIKRSSDGIITGRPVIPSAGWGTWSFNNPTDGVVLSGPPDLGRVSTPLLERLAGAYMFERRKGSSEKADMLLRVFLDVCEHLLDQGFAEGNNNISSNGFNVNVIMSMREELAKTGLLRDMLLAGVATSMALRGDVLLHEDWAKAGYFPRNTDVAIEWRRLLAMTALIPDPAERLQRLHAFQRSVSLLCDPSLGEPYAWDGTMHHHPQFNINYCAGVYFTEAYNLRGTCFSLYPEAMATLKRSLMALAFLGGASGVVPPNIPGYAGQPFGLNTKGLSALIAACGTAESRDGVDSDGAAIYLALAGDKTDDPLAGKFLAMGFKPFNFEGHVTLNGGSRSLHRRGDWLVSIAGQYKFRRSCEGAPSYIASAFNAYSRHGSVFVVSSGNPPSPWDSGFSLEGWDSRLIPGATSYLGETEGELLCRLGDSSSAFGGGTDMDGDGVWGLELVRQNAKLVDNIKFHKSAFCFGDRVTLLTTDIGRGEGAGVEERQLQFATTLFQNAFGTGGETERTAKGEGHFGANPPKRAPAPPSQEPCWIAGERVDAFPFETTLPAGSPRVVVDNKGTGYYVHAESPPLRVTRREQNWNYLWKLWAKPVQKYPKGDLRNFEPTVGDFATAWFEHGAKPDFSACAYTLVPQATPERMAEFARTMADPGTAPYKILQQDSRAHVLRDRDTQTTGYLVFDPSCALPGPLRKVNRPCAAMVKEAGGKLRVSTASTDMIEWPAYAALPGKIMLSGDIVLTLDGQWEIEKLDPDASKGCKADASQGKTVLTIPYETFLPAIMTLRPAKQP